MLWNDLRYTARMLRKSPLFTLAVVLTVALGIGANTAIFSVVNAVILRPLPFDHPDRLVWIAEKNDKLNLPQFSASVLNYLSWKEQTQTLDLGQGNLKGDIAALSRTQHEVRIGAISRYGSHPRYRLLRRHRIPVAQIIGSAK